MISNVRRVVVTGLGVVSSLGCQTKTVWEKVLAGECGITKITHPDFEKNSVKIAATVSKGDGGFVAEKWIAKIRDKEIITDELLFSFAAASQAVQDAKWNNVAAKEIESYGVSIGCVHASLNDLMEANNAFLTKGQCSISPHLISQLLLNTSAAIISKEFGFQGPSLVIPSACAASTHAIGSAFRLIRNGDADVMITGGGSEVCLNPFLLSAFERVNALTSKFNDNPTKSSRPFDKDRSGFVMADGAAFLILEEYEHAKQRNAETYAEILGYGSAGDAFHITSPSKDGRGAIRCMKAALRDANLQLKDICYINAHATSTPIGDAAENQAIKTLFGDHARNLKVSSTKGSTGHLQGAAGAIEAIFTTLAVKEGIAPPTLNLHEVSSETEFNLNYVPNKAQELSVCKGKKHIALSNSYGFGGTNCCLCIGEI